MHYNTQILLELKLYDHFAAGTSQGILQYKRTSRQSRLTSFQPASIHLTPVTFRQPPQMLLISARAKGTSHKLPQVLLFLQWTVAEYSN